MAKRFTKPEPANIDDLPSIQRQSSFTPFEGGTKDDKRYEALGEAVWGASAKTTMPDDIVDAKYQEASQFLSTSGEEGAKIMANMVKMYVKAIGSPRNKVLTVEFYEYVKDHCKGDHVMIAAVIAAVANVAYFINRGGRG